MSRFTCARSKWVKGIKTGKRDLGRKVTEIERHLKETETALERLYEAVEKGMLPLDEALRERAQKHKARREELLIELARLRRPEKALQKVPTRGQVELFCGVLKQRFADRSSNFGKEYLRLLVDRITLADREVVITGKSVAILQAMEKTKLGTLGRVPSFVPKWLPSTDSNRGPSG